MMRLTIVFIVFLTLANGCDAFEPSFVIETEVPADREEIHVEEGSSNDPPSAEVRWESP